MICSVIPGYGKYSCLGGENFSHFSFLTPYFPRQGARTSFGFANSAIAPSTTQRCPLHSPGVREGKSFSKEGIAHSLPGL